MRDASGRLVWGALGFVLVLISLLAVAGSFFAPQAVAAELQNRSLQLSNSSAGAANVAYQVGFTIATAGALGSIDVLFCSNSPLFDDPCMAPSGFDASSATLTSQTGAAGFSVAPSSTANEVILTRPSTVAAAVPASYTFTDVTNGSAAGSYYARISTFASSDASGAATDSGGLAFALNAAIDVQAYVPPFLLFCSGNTISAFDCGTAAGDFIDLGDFSADKTSSGTTQLVVATNGQSGYDITANGTTLESGNNEIPELDQPAAAQPGAGQFGINLRANTNPAVGASPAGPGSGGPVNGYDTPNQFKYHSGDSIAASPHADDYRKYTISYIVNIAHGQPVGVYASTFTYVATANF